jgi:methionyl-tRNA formyltransferase
MPSFWVMKNNEKYSGVSVFIIDKKIDTGNILCQTKFNIENLTHYELIKKSKKLGIGCIVSSIIKVLHNNFSFIKNNYKDSYNNFPTRDDIKEFKKLGKKFY